MMQKSQNIGSHEKLAFPKTDDQRAFFPHGNHGPGVFLMEDHQGIGSLNILQCSPDRLDQVQIPGVFIDEMGHDLRIGFRRKVDALPP